MKNLLALIFILLLSGCAYLPDWMGLEEEEVKLEGERLKVITEASNINVDQSLKSLPFKLAEAVQTNSYIEGASTTENILFSGSLKEKDSVSLNAPEEDEMLLISPPVIANEKIFVIDGEGIVSARPVNDIDKELWKYKILSEKKENFISGGITFFENNIIATSHDGTIASISAETGKENWKRKMPLPLRSIPVAAEGQIFVINVNNEMYAISAANGAVLWTNSGISEPAGLMGSSYPAVKSGVVITGYSSSEVYGLRTDSGKPLWGDSLESGNNRRAETFFAITDIDAAPVISGDMVFVGTNQSVFTARDVLSGRVIWEQNIGTTKTPWVSGDYIFVITTKDEVIAFYKNDGRARWITKLPSFEDEEKKEKIGWSPPIIANGSLFIAGSNGKLLTINPENGEIGKKYSIPENQFLRPVFASSKLFLLNNEGRLSIFE